MGTVKRHVVLNDKIIEKVESYATKHYDGNFSLSVRKLLEKSLCESGSLDVRVLT